MKLFRLYTIILAAAFSLLSASAAVVTLRPAGMTAPGTNTIAPLHTIGKEAALEEPNAKRGLTFRPWDGKAYRDYAWIYAPNTSLSFRAQAPAAPDAKRAVLSLWDWFGHVVFTKTYNTFPIDDTLTFKPECHGVWLVTFDLYGDATTKSLKSRLIKSFGTPIDATQARAAWREKNDYLLGSCYFPRRYFRWGKSWQFDNPPHPKLTPEEGIDQILGCAARAGLTMLRTDHFGRMSPGKPGVKGDWEQQDTVMRLMKKHGIQADLKVQLFVDCFQGATLERNAPVFAGWEEDLDYLIAHLLQPADSPVGLVEIGNEPAHQEFWRGTREQYEYLVKFAQQKIRAANPQIPVVHGATCPPGADLSGEKLTDPAAYAQKKKAQENWYLGFYQDMAATGNLWAYHYHGQLNGDSVAWRAWEKSALQKAGFTGAFLQTEGGRCSWRPDYEVGTWTGVMQKIIYSWSAGEKGWLQYSFTYDATPSRYKASQEGWALLHAHEFAPKFHYGAMAALAHTLAGCTHEGFLLQKNLDATPTIAALFQHPQGKIVVWFGPSPDTQLRIKSNAKAATLIDPMGNATRQSAAADLAVRCETYPQYLLLEAATKVEAR